MEIIVSRYREFGEVLDVRVNLGTLCSDFILVHYKILTLPVYIRIIYTYLVVGESFQSRASENTAQGVFLAMSLLVSVEHHCQIPR